MHFTLQFAKKKTSWSTKVITHKYNSQMFHRITKAQESAISKVLRTYCMLHDVTHRVYLSRAALSTEGQHRPDQRQKKTREESKWTRPHITRREGSRVRRELRRRQHLFASPASFYCFLKYHLTTDDTARHSPPFFISLLFYGPRPNFVANSSP